MINLISGLFVCSIVGCHSLSLAFERDSLLRKKDEAAVPPYVERVRLGLVVFLLKGTVLKMFPRQPVRCVLLSSCPGLPSVLP